MKYIIMILLLLIGLINVVHAETITDYSHITLVAEEVTPEPVEPGQDLTLKIRIVNDGTITADKVILNREFEYPFKLKSISQDTVEYKSLVTGASREETFYITISPRARSGTYPLKYKIETHYSSGAVAYSEQEILINVIGTPEIILETLSISDEIYPNSEFDLKLNVKNIGTGNARNIKISSDFEGIAPMGSNIILVEKLEAQNNSIVSVPFKVSGHIEPGFFQIPFNIEMSTEKGDKATFTQKIGITIINKADVSLKDLKIKPAGAVVEKPITVEIRVENIGDGGADNVYVELKFDDGTSITGNKKAYIGHLDKNDESPAFFTLNSKVSGKFPAKITIHYSDDLGDHIKTESMNISYKDDTSINYTLYGFILAGILVLIYFGKKMMGKKSK